MGLSHDLALSGLPEVQGVFKTAGKLGDCLPLVLVHIVSPFAYRAYFPRDNHVIVFVAQHQT